jgi:hypothetical protein
MNYSKIYEQLIERGVMRGWTKKTAPCYTEKHHIVPRSMGGSNEQSNLVVLTAKEHFVAYHLLWKIHKTREMFFALWSMMHDKRNSRIPFPEIPRLRELASVYNSFKGKDHPLYGIGHTEESRKKMSESHKGKILSTETRRKMSEARKGNTLQSKGVYYTPKGSGRSLTELAILNGCSSTTIQERCKRNPDKVIVGKKLPLDWRGKTFRELGWYYVPDKA